MPFMGKTQNLNAFEWGMVVGVRHTGLSMSGTAMLLGFSRSSVSRVHQEWSTTQRQASGRKWLIDESSQRRPTNYTEQQTGYS